MLIEDAVSSGTPQFVIDSYATLAERAKTQSFGLIEEDVIVLDTETTGLSVQDNELIEISAARLSGREIVDRFDTFVHPKQLIPAEITELTSITNADVVDAPSAVEAVAALADFVGGCPVIAHNATFDRSFIESVKGGVNVLSLIHILMLWMGWSLPVGVLLYYDVSSAWQVIQQIFVTQKVIDKAKADEEERLKNAPLQVEVTRREKKPRPHKKK